MDHLRKVWSEFDPQGSAFITTGDLIPFLTKLGKPLGFTDEEKTDMKAQNDFLKQIELPTYNGVKNFYYYDVIITLTQFAYLKIEAEKKFKKQLLSDTSGL